MPLLETTCKAIPPPDEVAVRETQRLLDAKTKPSGSLGRLEELACRLAAIHGNPTPDRLTPAVIVMAADHGVAEEGVSAYPAEVTAQMVRNFAAGGAAINVLARQAGTRLVVVDMGTRIPTEGIAGIRDCRLGPGTANFICGPAMTRETAVRALEIGIRLAGELADQGIGLLAVGDMGIGNTTAASALTAALTGLPVAELTGRGTGIDDNRWQHKIRVIEQALAVNRPLPHDPVDVLAKVGGFEIAGLAGVLLGAAARRLPVILDGFITAAAALLADRLCPGLRPYLLAGHRSVEPGHAVILRRLDLQPLLDLHLRLGEGTGAVLAIHLVEASMRILLEMATFETAGVSKD